MASLLHVIAPAPILLLLIGLLANASFPVRRYDCSNIIGTVPLERYKDLCRAIAVEENKSDKPKARGGRMRGDDDDDYYDEEEFEYSNFNRLDIVEMCTCNLLRHTFVWEAMLTHEVDTLFYVTQELIKRDTAEQEKEIGVPRDNWAYQNAFGDYTYFWDRLEDVLRRLAPPSPAPVEGDDFNQDLIDIFAKAYFNHEIFKMPYAKGKQVTGMRRLISNSCYSLTDQFERFIEYFQNLKTLAKNPRFTYRIATYDETLFKIIAVVKVCQFLAVADVLVN